MVAENQTNGVEMHYYLTGVCLVDPVSGVVTENGAVEISAGNISAIGKRSDFPKELDAVEYKMDNGYLLPGLFNCHAHLALNGDSTPYDVKLPILKELSEEYRIIEYLTQARKNLASGVTGVRDLHPGPAGTMWGYKLVQQLTDTSAFSGARLYVSGAPLVVTGGHGTHWLSKVVNGVDGVRQAVKENIADGSDVIKLMTAYSWGPLPNEPVSWATYFTEPELRAAVETAHSFGIPVAAHCHGESTLGMIVDAGIDSVEHGSGLTPEIASRMAERGTYLVPTLASYDNFASHGADNGVSAKRTSQAHWVRERQRNGFQIALEEGVRVAAGSDAGFHLLGHGESLIRELELYVELGMKPIDALQSATNIASELVGVSDQVGTLNPGMKADFIITQENPVENISNLRTINTASIGGVMHATEALQAQLSSSDPSLRDRRRTYKRNVLRNTVDN